MCVRDDGSCFLSPADGPLWLPPEVCSPTVCWRGAERGYVPVCVQRRGGIGSQNKEDGGLKVRGVKVGAHESSLGELGEGSEVRGRK